MFQKTPISGPRDPKIFRRCRPNHYGVLYRAGEEVGRGEPNQTNKRKGQNQQERPQRPRGERERERERENPVKEKGRGCQKCTWRPHICSLVSLNLPGSALCCFVCTSIGSMVKNKGIRHRWIIEKALQYKTKCLNTNGWCSSYSTLRSRWTWRNMIAFKYVWVYCMYCSTYSKLLLRRSTHEGHTTHVDCR